MRNLVFLVAIVSLLQSSSSQTVNYECTLEKMGDNGEEYCVFRDVQYSPAASVSFNSPGSAKPERIAFRGSSMENIPSEFLRQFSTDLKVLNVEDCQLKSVTITNGLEALYAKSNSIEKVIVHQSGQGSVLRELDLSRNPIKDIRNITRCQNLIKLNLSGNTGILNGDVLELSNFAGLNNLQELYLSHLDANYMDNTKNIGLDSLLLLDLSYNNLIPSDLRMEVFYPFKKLQTLRLNDNHMGSLDYNLLLNIKSLRTVYINGNDFKCEKIKPMLEHLNKNNVMTPTEKENYDCKSQQGKTQDMCCVGMIPIPPPIPPPTREPVTRPTPATDTPSGPATDTPRIDTPDDSGSGGKGSLFIILGVVAALLAVAAIVGFFVYKKKQSASRDMNAENALPLRNN